MVLFVTQKYEKEKVTLCLFIKRLLIRHASRDTFLAAARSRSGSDSPRAVIHSPRAASLPAGEGWRKSLLSSAYVLDPRRHLFSAGVLTMRARICSAISCDMFARVVWLRLWAAQNRRFSPCHLYRRTCHAWLARLTRARGRRYIRGRKALLYDFWYFWSRKSTIKEKYS